MGKCDVTHLRSMITSGEVSQIRRAIAAMKACGATRAQVTAVFAGTVLKTAVYGGKRNPLLDDECAKRCELIIGAIRHVPALLARCKTVVHRMIHDGCTNDDYLSLDGVTRLSTLLAEAIATYDGGVSLDGLTSLSAETAHALASHQEGFLSLNGLRLLTPAAATALGQFRDSLSLDGLTSLSLKAAEELARHQADLSLDGLARLSDAAARMLAQHKGSLSLNGIKQLSDESANSLALYESEHWLDVLSLDGLTCLSNEAAKALRANKSIRLPAKFRRGSSKPSSQ